MTEKNMSGKINELLETLKDDEKRQAFLNDFEEFLTNYHQPAFAVGEYYVSRAGIVYKVISIDDKNLGIKSLIGCELIESNMFYKSVWGKTSKPATAEQIAEFKLAQFYHENNISETQKDQYRKMLSNGKMPIGPWQELQEVENNE